MCFCVACGGTKGRKQSLHSECKVYPTVDGCATVLSLHRWTDINDMIFSMVGVDEVCWEGIDETSVAQQAKYTWVIRGSTMYMVVTEKGTAPSLIKANCIPTALSLHRSCSASCIACICYALLAE